MGYADVVRGVDCDGWVPEQVRVDCVVQPERGECCGRAGACLASVVRDPGAAVLLLALLFREWCGSHRSDVHSIFVSGDGAGDATSVWGAGAGVFVESDGGTDALRNRVSSGVLRGGLRAAVTMVGVRVFVQRGEPCDLAGSGRSVVEVFGPPVG